MTDEARRLFLSVFDKFTNKNARGRALKDHRAHRFLHSFTPTPEDDTSNRRDIHSAPKLSDLATYDDI